MANPKKTPFFSRLKVTVLVVGIILIPMVMDQAQMNDEDVKVVGRVCGGIAGIVTIYGIFTKLLKVFAFVLLAVIALAVLVSENLIEAPRLTEFFS